MSSDPIGLNGGLNTYVYVEGNPLYWIDIFGLEGMVFDRPSGTIFYENSNGDITNSWSATSGPWGNGELEPGNYAMYPPATVPDTHPNQSSYCDTNSNCWWSKLDPLFETDRTGLGIHPDGNVPGTEGCVGATENNTKSLREFIKELTEFRGQYTYFLIIDRL